MYISKFIYKLLTFILYTFFSGHIIQFERRSNVRFRHRRSQRYSLQSIRNNSAHLWIRQFVGGKYGILVIGRSSRNYQSMWRIYNLLNFIFHKFFLFRFKYRTRLSSNGHPTVNTFWRQRRHLDFESIIGTIVTILNNIFSFFIYSFVYLFV